MTNPTKYDKGYDFSGFQEAQPKSPLPATRLDTELLNIEQSIGETIDALRDVRRDDGALRNQIVTPDSLSAATRVLLARDINPRGVWASGAAYAVKDSVSVAGATYLAITPHVAGPAFADDLEAGLWLLIANPFSIGDEVFSQVFDGDGVTTTFTLSQEFTAISELAVYVQDGSSGYHRMRSAGADPQVSLGGPTQLVFAAAPGAGTANIIAEAINQTAAAASASAKQSADAAAAARDAAEQARDDVDETISGAVAAAVASAHADAVAQTAIAAGHASAAAASAGEAATAAGTAAADVSALLDGKVVAATAAKTSAEAARDQVLALYDTFDDRYLGVHASDPTTDNDGNPLFPGALYFQQVEAGVDGVMKVYTGVAWVSAYVQGGDFIEKDRAWPIGSIYVNATNATNPAVLLGFGTWSAIGQGRVLVGAGTGIDINAASWSFAAGTTGGEYIHILTEAEMPGHVHTGTAAIAGAHTHYSAAAGGGYGPPGVQTLSGALDSSSSSIATNAAGAHTHALTIDLTGGGQAHANVQPYLAVYMWVRTA